MKRTTTMLLCLLGIGHSYGQNPKWDLPPKYYNTSANSLSTLPTAGGGYTGAFSNYCHNSMIDPAGNLKFFISDEFIYNSSGNMIGQMYGATGDPTGSQEICIVPDPGNCKRYYIFSSFLYAAQVDYPWRPSYSVLDLGTNGLIPFQDGNTAKDMVPLITAPSNSQWGIISSGHTRWTRVGLAVTKPRSDGSYFIFVHDGVQNIYKYLLNASGLTYQSMFKITTNVNGFENQIQRAEMEVVELAGGGYRLATVYTTTYLTNEYIMRQPEVFYTDLNSSGDPVPGTAHTFRYYTNYTIEGTPPNDHAVGHPTYVHGLEFSPNGRYLYVAKENNPQNLDPYPLEYFDCQAINPTPIAIAFASDGTPFQYSQLEIGNGKLYAANSTKLAVLTNPNVPNSANWNFSYQSSIGYNYNDEYSGSTSLRSYILPDQIDGLNYFDHFSGTPACCVENEVYDKENFTASVNATWTGTSNPINGGTGNTVTIKQTLVIPAGKAITIQGMTFKFAPGAKVIIEPGTTTLPGGRLTLNGTTFTVDDRCGGPFWQGVQVHGSITNNQTPINTSKQGFFSMTNASRIENARIGVTLAKRNQSAVYPFNWTTSDATYAGGIVKASNSSFTNNIMDVEFLKYNAPNGINNQSAFTNTDFITNGLLNDPAVFTSWHVYMNDVVGVNFNGCTFRNMTPASYNYYQQGVGIVAFDAHFSVKARCTGMNNPCTSFDRGLLRDLSGGIYAFSSNPLRTAYIDRIDFINNYGGIHLSGTQSATVTRSYFEVNRNPVQMNFGLVLRSCTGYKVEENEFTEYADVVHPSNGNTYGIVVDNSGVLHNEIYLNRFHDIRVGGQAQGLNGENFNYGDPNASNQGLQWRCNTFYNNLFQADISVTSGKIDYQQGYCLTPSDPNAVKTPAGNTFSHSTFNAQNDIWANNSVLTFNYAHHNGVPTTPQYYSNTVVVAQPCNINISSAACPSKINDGGIIVAQHKSRSAALKTSIAGSKHHIDNGSTANMLALVAAGGDDLAQDLLDASPYLSYEVLMAYLLTSPNENELTDVMVANSPLSPVIMDYLSGMGLSDGAMHEIETAQTGVSHMQDLMNEISAMESEVNVITDELVRYYLTDSLVVHPLDSIIALLQNEGSRTRKEQLCDAYILAHKASAAQAVLDDLENTFGKTNYEVVAETGIALMNQPSPADYLRSHDDVTASLELVAADVNDKINAAKAKALLTLANDQLYLLAIETLYNPYGTKSYQAGVSADANNILTLYPNPSNEKMTLMVNVPSNMGYDVQVYSLTGQKILQSYIYPGNSTVMLDAAQIPAGIYLVKLSEGGDLKEAARWIVQH